MPARLLPHDVLETILTRLHESHDLSAYEAVERLVHAGEAAGFDTDTLLRMLDHGVAFQKLLELIAAKATSVSEDAPIASKRESEPISQAQSEKALKDLLVA